MKNLTYFDVDRIFDEIATRLSAEYPGEVFSLIIVGGASLMQFDYRKESPDIDGFTVSDNKIKKFLTNEVLNFRSSGMSSSFSADMEERIIETPFSRPNLKIYSASLEDIVASKLIANRDKDMEDIRLPGVIENLNFELLDNIIKDELSIDIVNEYNYRQLLRVYADYLNDVLGEREHER